MFMFARGLIRLIFVIVAAPAAFTQQATIQPPEIREWPVPWAGTRPRDPYLSPDGTVWFVGQQGHYLGRLDPATGQMSRFDLGSGTGPHTVIVDDTGTPWYAGNTSRHIGAVDPAGGTITRFAMPTGVNDPHSMVWRSDGRAWFTVQRSPPAGYIGLFSPSDGMVQTVRVPGSGMRPYGIAVDNDDRPWIAFMGSNAIGTVDPATMQLEIIPTPDSRSRIRRLSIDSRGRVWWVDAAAGFFGVYDPTTRTMRQWQSPAGARANLYATAVDNADRFWFVEAGPRPNTLVAFDTVTEQIVSRTTIPSGGIVVRHMVYDAAGNALWFGTDAHTIGRAALP